ncbi:MAG: hypothetical protein IH983_11325 [Planctomycetes bacterium]|nr:hypothetical protein [Planctomycetota bacterium]
MLTASWLTASLLPCSPGWAQCPVAPDSLNELVKLTASDGLPLYWFGRSVSISGDVGILDLLALLAAWGSNPGHPADFNNDGNVGILDLLALLANWGPCA